MGNSNEEARIRNRHAEEIARIEAMNEENERRAAIERLALENGYKLDLKRIENLAEQARMEHQRKLKEIEYDAENKRRLADIQRNKDEMEDRRLRDEIEKGHEIKVKELLAKEKKDQMEHDRLTEDMRRKHELESKKQSDDYLLKTRELDIKREHDKVSEEHRYDEKIKEIESKKEVELKKIEVEKLAKEKEIKLIEVTHDKDTKILQHNHEEKLKQAERDMKNDEHRYDLEKEKRKEDHEKETLQIKNNFNITMENIKGNNEKNKNEMKLKEKQQDYEMKKLELEYQLKLKEMEMKKQQNNSNFFPQFQDYPMNYYHMQIYQNPGNFYPNPNYQSLGQNLNQKPVPNSNYPAPNPYWSNQIPNNQIPQMAQTQQMQGQFIPYNNYYPMNQNQIPKMNPMEIKEMNESNDNNVVSFQTNPK